MASTIKVEFRFLTSWTPSSLLHHLSLGVRSFACYINLSNYLTSFVFDAPAIGLKPKTERPSSVSVPVLSKTKVEICPAMLILGGEMQKMSTLFNLLMANTIPHDIAAGMAGGTVTVMRSSALSIKI